VVLDVGYLMQQRSAANLPALRARHPVAALHAFLGARSWLLGVVLTLVGWLVYLAALSLADISLVQATSAGGIAILVVIAVRWFGARLSPSERLGTALAAAGLLALGLSLIGYDDSGREQASDLDGALWVGVSAALALLLLAPGAARLASVAAVCGLSAGLLFGAGDVATKGLLVTLPTGLGVAGVPASPFLYAMLAVYGLGFVVQQLAFQRGAAVVAIGVMVAATNVSPIVAGLVVFNDPLPNRALGLVLRIGGFALALAGSALLARVSEGEAAAPAPTAAPVGAAS
jgi:hypothetical protein